MYFALGASSGSKWGSREKLMSNGIDARPKNWLVPVALAVLREESTYGYELMKRLAGFGFEALNPGTLYRTLKKMEQDGLCQTEWDTSNNGSGPACRVYLVTPAGEAHLASWAAGLKKYQEVLDSFFLAHAYR